MHRCQKLHHCIYRIKCEGKEFEILIANIFPWNERWNVRIAASTHACARNEELHWSSGGIRGLHSHLV